MLSDKIKKMADEIVRDQVDYKEIMKSRGYRDLLNSKWYDVSSLLDHNQGKFYFVFDDERDFDFADDKMSVGKDGYSYSFKKRQQKGSNDTFGGSNDKELKTVEDYEKAFDMINLRLKQHLGKHLYDRILNPGKYNIITH